MPRKAPVRTERAQVITDHIYESVKASGGNVTAIYAATLKRVRELLDGRDDPDEVEVVCLALADQDGDKFVSWRSLGWGSYEFFRDQLNVPKGGWVYALAAMTANEQYADSIDYWLRKWRDSELNGDEVGVYESRQKLEQLLSSLRYHTDG